jgi:hypothetical protein
MGRLTDVGPAGLVPAAWLVTIAAHRSVVTERTLLIALGVMDVLLLAFIIASRGEMTGSVLPIWRRVLIAGFLVTLAGTVGLALDPNQSVLTGIGLYGWIALPGVAYLQTGQAHEGGYRRLYLSAGALSLAGGVVYAAGQLGNMSPDATILAGLVVVGGGQTVGIVAAAIQNAERRS